ncbi:MAG TPA: GxxExxY protein [Terriglobales bacterium]|nr:GxxExxY protein [Terriglobales bacterium]
MEKLDDNLEVEWHEALYPNDTYSRRDLICGDVTAKIIGAAIEVHRILGPGLLESAYEECFCHELHERKLTFARQVALPVIYKAVKLDCGYKIDLVVADSVVVELKATERMESVFEAQLLTYLRLSGKRVGLLINFGLPVLRRGGILRRVI